MKRFPLLQKTHIQLENKNFAKNLILWFYGNKRDLPWRNITDAYKIWLSEIILQQTRVAQGLPYYEKFVQQYPTIQALAAADEREVLRLWQGLGYYSRARNMHATARFITENLDAKFPESYIELIKLKGIGTYTAAAIASFAYQEKVAVLDGNVYRVLARFFGETTDISSNNAKKVFNELATNLLPDKESETYNQAIMEFGAIQCTPVKPDCMFCPVSLDCVANQTSQQAFLPVKTKKTKVRKRFFHYFIVEQNNLFLMKKRGKEDIWEGLFDFYLLENGNSSEFRVESSELDILKILENDLALNNPPSSIHNSSFIIKNQSEIFKHILSHQRIEAKFWHIQLNPTEKIDLPSEYSFYSLSEIEELPKPILIQNYLKKNFF
jgi:A/G-specific adenine glycosylase